MVYACISMKLCINWLVGAFFITDFKKSYKNLINWKTFLNVENKNQVISKLERLSKI